MSGQSRYANKGNIPKVNFHQQAYHSSFSSINNDNEKIWKLNFGTQQWIALEPQLIQKLSKDNIFDKFIDHSKARKIGDEYVEAVNPHRPLDPIPEAKRLVAEGKALVEEMMDPYIAAVQQNDPNYDKDLKKVLLRRENLIKKEEEKITTHIDEIRKANARKILLSEQWLKDRADAVHAFNKYIHLDRTDESDIVTKFRFRNVWAKLSEQYGGTRFGHVDQTLKAIRGVSSFTYDTTKTVHENLDYIEYNCNYIEHLLPNTFTNEALKSYLFLNGIKSSPAHYELRELARQIMNNGTAVHQQLKWVEVKTQIINKVGTLEIVFSEQRNQSKAKVADSVNVSESISNKSPNKKRKSDSAMVASNQKLSKKIPCTHCGPEANHSTEKCFKHNPCPHCGKLGCHWYNCDLNPDKSTKGKLSLSQEFLRTNKPSK